MTGKEIIKPGGKRASAIVTGTAFLLLTSAIAANAHASPIQDAIAEAQLQFGGEAFEAEWYREDGRPYVEVELLRGNRIIEAEYDVRRGVIVDSDVYKSKRRVARVKAALERARISLADAVEIAEDAAGSEERLGTAREAELRLSRTKKRNGNRFEVEVRNEEGLFDVYLRSRNGRVNRIEAD